MSGIIEALYIYEDNRPILTHVYASRPLSANQLLPLYKAYAHPRPNLIYLSNTNPSTLVFSLIYSNLLFLLSTTSEIEPLLVLEFLHRVVDALEEFVGSPLLAPKIESNYEVVAQLLNEMCDAGSISTTEPNGLRDLVEVEGWIGKLLGNINIPVKPGLAGSSSSNNTGISLPRTTPMNTNALPWRRANVRHTSNELYVDIIETLSVTLAPSGRPLSAFANGTVILTSKISGVPELQLNLSVLSGKQNINNVIENPVFHPCVRLARWKENPGEISFIPPDGKFILAGYGVDLFPMQNFQVEQLNPLTLRLPVSIEVKTGLGLTGSEFEIRLLIIKVSGQTASSISNLSSRTSVTSGRVSARFGKNLANSNSSLLQDLVVSIPLPKYVRNLPEIRASRGEITYIPGGRSIDWEISAKEAAVGGATLRCTAAGTPCEDESNFRNNDFDLDNSYSGYQEDAFQKSATKFNSNSSIAESSLKGQQQQPPRDHYRISQNKLLMPNSAIVSFTVKGWLASGIKVESLVVDSKKSRGLGDGVKPYTGVKYLTVSRKGVEMRC
ncbi:AP-3 complex subunit mu [Erysiphe necator]|uniref:Putative adaptor complexes medium subunit family protein n=1 Tax=Uncinula necator TaxID=52586 RepID=A0A0B1PCV9_UNCNE|nr:AP-3 complex subunit mu [Erysiphe necator]KHJ36093.1 putative adaptor complexes medium subunit family protein [Erysiphe necator]